MPSIELIEILIELTIRPNLIGLQYEIT